MAKTASGQKKVVTSNDVIRGNLHGSSLVTARINRAKASSGGKKKGKAKIKVLTPPVGCWRGGHPDVNGMKKSETYTTPPMRLAACRNKGRIQM